MLVLPWRQWHKQNTLGALEADRAAAVAVLHGLHQNFDVTTQDIDIIYTNRTHLAHSRPKVVALKAIESESIWLPACTPKQSRVYESSENPNAVSLFVTVLRSAESAVNSPEGHILRSREFKIVPEFKVPTRASSASNPAVADENGWIFDDGAPDSMHPFWAVRRLSQEQLEKERRETKPGNWSPRFTCEVRYSELSSVCVYARIACGNTTRNCSVPFITNIGQLEEGEELIVEVVQKEKQQKPRARTWGHVEQEVEKLRNLPQSLPNRSDLPQSRHVAALLRQPTVVMYRSRGSQISTAVCLVKVCRGKAVIGVTAWSSERFRYHAV